jgi:hypothetical protein
MTFRHLYLAFSVSFFGKLGLLAELGLEIFVFQGLKDQKFKGSKVQRFRGSA